MGTERDKDVIVDRGKFDGLLKKMVESPPLPMEDVKVTKPKPKKGQRRVSAK